MAIVVDNNTVAALWAEQSQPSARSHNGNFSFDGPLLYSYLTCIGAIHGDTALLTSLHYSTTTAGKHLPPARRWTQYRAIEVPYPADPHHPANLAHLESNYDKAIERLRFMRGNREPVGYELDAPVQAAGTLARYHAAFHVKSSPPQWARDVADALEYHRATVAAWNDPKAVEKRLRAQAKRDLMRLVEARP